MGENELQSVAPSMAIEYLVANAGTWHRMGEAALAVAKNFRHWVYCSSVNVRLSNASDLWCGGLVGSMLHPASMVASLLTTSFPRDRLLAESVFGDGLSMVHFDRIGVAWSVVIDEVRYYAVDVNERAVLETVLREVMDVPAPIAWIADRGGCTPRDCVVAGCFDAESLLVGSAVPLTSVPS